jgi:tripartite-type tricarboxylate transporter receptor subunit TctC
MTSDSKRRALLQAAGASLIVGASSQARAQASSDYPRQPIKMVVPYPPGGGTDVIARILQQRVSQNLGQQLIIENRGGAGGSIGSLAVAKSPADGYTILFTLSSHTINPAIIPKLGFDAIADFEPIVMAASLPQILVATPSFPANTVAELIAAAKRAPNTLSFASVGNGSPGHLAGELFMLRTGTQMAHVPYRGGGPAVTDVMAGQVPLLWVSIPAAAQFVKQGKLKALAVSTVKRSAAFPDVPTVQEAGVSDFEVDSWYAAFAPAKTPAPIIERLNKAFNEALTTAEVREKLLAQGSEAVGGTPAALARVVAAEIPKWAKLVKDANIKPD